jgi:hypothetical protein
MGVVYSINIGKDIEQSARNLKEGDPFRDLGVNMRILIILTGNKQDVRE